MSGKMRPALLNQVLEELNIMERQPRPAFGKAKRDCIRALVHEKQNCCVNGKEESKCEYCDFSGGYGKLLVEYDSDVGVYIYEDMKKRHALVCNVNDVDQIQITTCPVCGRTL